MTTDNTNIQSETANSTVANESDVERANLTQGATQVQLPAGEPIVRIQVTPGETVQLPFPQDQMAARLDDGNGNLAIKVGDVTVILQGYVAAQGEADVNVIDVNGEQVDLAVALAAGENLDIETAAGPGAGDQGTGVDNNGGVFSPFDPRAGIGGLNAIGGLNPTALEYPLIQREFLVFELGDEGAAIPLPTVVSITPGIIVNEDDFGRGANWGEPDNQGEIESARASFNISNDMPSGGYNILSRLGELLPNSWCASFGKAGEGNDPFDVDNYDKFDGKFDGVDSSKEPLSSTAIIEVNYQGSFPGRLTFDANGDGIDTGDSPVMQQLAAMGLTSQGHELAYMLIPAVPESFPGANDGTGQMIVAYYLDKACNCYSQYEGDGESLVPVIVFTISIGDDAANGNELNANGNNEIPVTYSIYGVIDNATKGEGEAGEDILNLPIPFYVTNGGGTTEVPSGLGFNNVDDVPSLGSVKYGYWNDLPVAIVSANLTIGHDESKGSQNTGYDSDHQPNKGTDQYTDDVGGSIGQYLINKADKQLDGIAQDNASGEDVDVSYQQGILSQLSSEFLSNGNFNAQALGVAKTYINVSFGADGKAKGNDQAGETLFRHDNDKGVGTDNSGKNYDSQGNLIGNQAGTDKQAFELFMSKAGGATDGDNLLDSSQTNWKISYQLPDGTVVVLDVYAYQLDANTIIGMAFKPQGGNEGGGGNDYQLLQGGEGNGYGEGITGEGDGIPVFMLRLDPQTGQLTLVQYHQVNNPVGGDSNHPDWDSSANDPIHLYDANGNPLVYFQATDFDGDTVTARLEVSVIDDAPKAKDDYAVLDETKDPGNDGLNKVTGNVILGISNDGVKNDTGKDGLSVDHTHTIPQLKYGNSTITVDFENNTASGTGTDATNVQYNPTTGVLSFDTPHGHFTIVVKSTEADPDSSDSSTDSSQLGYYEYTGAFNAEREYFGVPKDSDGTEYPQGANDTQKVQWLLGQFGDATLSNNRGGNDTSASNWSFKEISAGGKTYSGIGVSNGIDGGETDGNEWIKVVLPEKADSVKVTLGALFDGQLHDAGNREYAKWEAWNGNVLVASGIVTGDYDGLVDFYINVDKPFDTIKVSPVDNSAGNNGNNSDFLLVGVAICDEQDVTEKIKYKLQDVDGDYDSATLTISVKDGKPKISDHSSTLSIKIDEDGLPAGNQNNKTTPQGNGDIVGGNGAGDADGRENTATGHIAYNVYADGLGTVFLSSDSSLKTVDGKNVLFAWDPANNRLIGFAEGDAQRIVIEVKLSNTGPNGTDFEVVLKEPLKHPSNNSEDNVDFKFKVTVADTDCDIDTATVTVKINDDAPILNSVTYALQGGGGNDGFYGLIDEDFIKGGNKDKDGTPGDNGGGASVSGKINVNFGADGPANGSHPFSLGVSNGTALSGIKTSQGDKQVYVKSSYQGENLVITGYTNNPGGKDVFTLTVKKDGSFEFKLIEALEHTNPQGQASHEDPNLLINIALQAADRDGDKIPVGLKFSVDDDAPKASIELKYRSDVTIDESPNRQEDDASGTPPAGLRPSDYGQTTTLAWGKSGNPIVSTDVDYGADGAAASNSHVLSIKPASAGVDSGLNATGGGDIFLYQDGDKVVGRVGGEAGPVAFVLSIGQDGKLTVVQFLAIEHQNTSSPNDAASITNGALKVVVTATDSDGDTVSAEVSAGKTVIFKDDGPSAGYNKDIVIDDDDVAGANGIAGGKGDLDPIRGKGTLAHDFGTDDAGAVVLTNANLPGGQGFTQAVTDGGTKLTISQNGVPVIEVTVNSATGAYEVKQLAPVKHPSGGDENNVNFTLNYKVVDGDGDSVNGSVKLTVNDDTPTVGEQLQWTVDEDSSNGGPGLPGAIQGGPGDNNGGTPDYIGFADKPLGINFGADGPAANPYQFSTTFVARDQDGAPLALKSGGQDVTLVWAGNVLTGWAGGVEVFTLTIDQANGTASFQLKGPLDHPDNNGSEYEDTISIEFGFTAEDRDGDKVNHSVKIFVNDDSPDACCMREPLVIEEPVGNGDTKGGTTVQEITITPSTYDANNPGAVTISAGIYDLTSSKGKSTDSFTPGGSGAAVFDNDDDSVGFGVTSNTDGGSGSRYDELNYLGDGKSGDHRSEYISFKLTDDDQTASKVELTLKYFFPNEQMEEAGKGKGQTGVADEVGAYKLYKDGVAVSDWIEFKANDSSGNFTLTVEPGIEFDEIRMIAKRGDGDDRNGNDAGDSSDYYVNGVTFTVAGTEPEQPEPKVVSGTICADYGADGPGSVVLLAGNPTGLKHNGSDIVETVDQNGNLQGKANGVLVYEVVLDVGANKFDFKLYQPIDGSQAHNLDFNYVVTDNDGDSDTGCIKIEVAESFSAEVRIADSPTAYEDPSLGLKSLSFVVTMSETNNTGAPVKVFFTLGGASGDVDTSGLTSEGGGVYSILIPNGSDNATITLPVKDDQDVEVAAEAVTVHLTGTDNGDVTVAGSGVGTGNIVDLNGTVTIDPSSVTEGNNLQFAVNMNLSSGELAPGTVVRVALTWANVTAEDNDTGARPAYIDLIVNAGGTTASGTIVLSTTNDNVYEGNETLTVTPGTVTVDPTGTPVVAEGISGTGNTGTIIDNETMPTVSISDAPTVAEGSGQNLIYTVTLSGPAEGTVTVDFTTANGTAIAGSDYTTKSGTITFAPGETTKTIEVVVVDDDVAEPTENVLVNLSNPNGATIVDGQGTGDITDDDKHTPTLSASNGIVDEDFLTKATNGVDGNQDQPAPAPHDAGGTASATGTYTVDFHGEGGNVAFNVVDGADTGVDTLAGTNIVWDRVSDTQLVGHAAGNPSDQYFTMSLNTGTGQWTFTLLKAIKHAENSNEDQVDPVVSVGIIATDNNGGETATATINITIDDDMPIVANDSKSVNESSGGATANVMFILDVSGSMGWVKDQNNVYPTGNQQSRLQIAKEAIQATVQKYLDAVGGDVNAVRFQLVTFSGNASVPSNTWMTAADFLALLANTNLGQNATDYDAPLIAAQNAFGASGSIDGAANVSYFLSDGEPNEGDSGDGFNQHGPTAGTTGDSGIGAGEEAAWITFLTNNDIVSHAIGMGPGSTVGAGSNDDELDPIAYNGATGTNLNAIGVADMANLETVLGDTVTVPVAGNLLENDFPGADGWANQAITKVVFGDTTGLPDANGVITIVTAAGTLTVYGKDYLGNDAGDYTFVANAVDADTPLSFTYTAVDGDGDAVNGTLSITVLNANEAPVAQNVQANGNEDAASIAVALSGTDDSSVTHFKLESLPTNGTLFVNGVAAATGVDYAYGLPVTFTPNANYNGQVSFTYTVKDDDGLYDATPATAIITVNPVNDTPTAAINPTSYAATEQVYLNLHGTGLSVGDAADGNTGSMTVTLSVGYGQLNVTAGSTGASVSGNNTSIVTITGTVAQINNLLNGSNSATVRFYAHTDTPPASTTLTLHINDNGNVGGGALTASDTATISITDTPENAAPVGNADRIVTNQTGAFTVQTAWLLRNDNDPDGTSPWISAVNGASSLSLGSTGNLPNSFTVDLASNVNENGESGSFNYVLTDGSLSDNSNAVQVVLDNSGAIDGGSGNDIVIGGSSGETLNGGNGDDILVGNGGNDTLNGGSGIDWLFGGDGNDTLIYDNQDKFDGGSGFDRVQVTGSGVTIDYDGVGADARFVGIELIDLGDGNNRSSSANQNTINIRAEDVLDLGNNAHDTGINLPGGADLRIDLFIVGDNEGGNANSRDNVNLTGFTQVGDVSSAGGTQSTFTYDVPGDIGSRTYTVWTDGGGKYIAIESGLDVTTN